MFQPTSRDKRPLGRSIPGESSNPHPRVEITNFGGNQVWKARCYRPETEAHILEILNFHRRDKIRAVGALYSWSGAPVSQDVTLDMSCFHSIETYPEGDDIIARVGAGTSIQSVLELLTQKGRTLPALGAVTQQSISGAISTATHGSGNPSLSHFVQSVRVAAYDPESGAAKIFQYDGGDQLRAARCSLGTMGILLSVDISTVPLHLVEEKIIGEDSLKSVLDSCVGDSLSQFALTPYRWDYLVFQRTKVDFRALSTLEKLKGRFFSVLNFCVVDVIWHLVLKGAIAIGPSAVTSLLHKTPDLVLQNVPNIGTPKEILTLAHDLFDHQEMEIFIPSHHLESAIELLRYSVELFSGEDATLSADLANELKEAELYLEIQSYRRSYHHHYPFLFRRVRPEDDMLGMASGNQDYFSCSVFTYRAPDQRDDFERFCSWLARSFNALFGARLHWGKHFPLDSSAIKNVYPELERFREIAAATDPEGVFRNRFVNRVLGF